MTTSFVKMPASIVRERCKRTLKHIEAVRKENDIRFLSKKLKSLNKFRNKLPFLFGKPLTKEEVVQFCESSTDFHVILYYPSNYEWDTKKTAKNLLKATEVANTITVSVRDLIQLK